jgi:hypothetical protein
MSTSGDDLNPMRIQSRKITKMRTDRFVADDLVARVWSVKCRGSNLL